MEALPPTPFRLHRLYQTRKQRVSIQVSKSDPPSKSLSGNPSSKNYQLPVVPLEQRYSRDRGHESFIYPEHNDNRVGGDRTTPRQKTFLTAPSDPVSCFGLCPSSPEQQSERQATLTSPEPKSGRQTTLADPGQNSERQTTLTGPGEKLERQTTLTVPGEILKRQATLAHPKEKLERQTTSPRIWKSKSPERGQDRRVSVEFTLPEFSDRKRYPSCSEEMISFTEPNAIHEYALEMGHSDLEPVPSPTMKERANSGTSNVTSHQQGHERDRSSVTSCVTPLAREISEIIESVRQKNDELLAVKAAVIAINSELKPAERDPKDSDQVQLLQARSKSLPAKLPNTRYRCRTCFERLRDNAHYRQSVSMNDEQKTGIRSKGGPENRDRTGEFPNLPPKDLDGNVINALGKSASNKAKSWPKYTSIQRFQREESLRKSVSPDRLRRAGIYSRSRIDQLAVPKGGPKPKLKISGRVLRRQAEALRHPHDKSRLTEREQDRLLRLQSRVQRFLALLQERQMPSGMVHIPQREDIMHVDISHIG